jgi:integrase
MRVFERKGKKGSTWYIDYTYKGRRIMEAVGPDRKLAKAVARKRETEIFEGKFFPEKTNSKIKLKDFANEYMEKHSKRNKRSWRRDEFLLKHLLPVFGDMYLSDITPKMVEDYRIKRERDGLNPTTINREHGLLKHMFTKAIDWGMARENPAKKVKLAKEKPRSRFLTKEEIHRLLEAAESSMTTYLKPMLVLAFNTAMRKGEIFNLKWEDVDFERRAIQVKKTKNDQPREIPMTDWLFETLWDLRQQGVNNSHVFVSRENKPLVNIWKVFRLALKKAGIKDFRFHDLRHTAASQMYMSGLDIKFIKEIGGWKTLQMVDRYSHIATEHKRRSMLMFETHICPPIETNLKQKELGPRKLFCFNASEEK